jgi:hypothetical protein
MLYTQQEPKNKKAKRALLVREPKLVENEKRALFIHGHSNSNNGKLFLDEMVCVCSFLCCEKLFLNEGSFLKRLL